MEKLFDIRSFQVFMHFFFSLSYVSDLIFVCVFENKLGFAFFLWKYLHFPVCFLFREPDTEVLIYIIYIYAYNIERTKV